MSVFLRHSPCPRCGSRDNLGIWDDHEYCFGCKYYRDLRSLGTMVGALDPPGRVSREPIHSRSSRDISLTLPVSSGEFRTSPGFLWLNKYGITLKEIALRGIIWDASSQHLVYPIYDGDGTPIFYSVRNFSGVGPKALHFPKGQSPPIDIHRQRAQKSPTIVCVEDVVSAIKVARVIDCICLYGSAISKETAKYLAKEYDCLLVWLDFDKTTEALKYTRRYQHLFKKTDIVVSEKDPKEYSTTEIKDFLKEYL